MAVGSASEDAGRCSRARDDWLGVGGERCAVASALAADGFVLFVRFHDANRREPHQRLFRFPQRCRRRTETGSETRLCARMGHAESNASGDCLHDIFGLHHWIAIGVFRRLENGGGRRGLRAVLLPLHDPFVVRWNGRPARGAVFRCRARHNDLLFSDARSDANCDDGMFAAVGGVWIGGRYAVGGEQRARHRQRPSHRKTNPHRGDGPTTRASSLFLFGVCSRDFGLFSAFIPPFLGCLAADYPLPTAARGDFRRNVENRAGRSVESHSRKDRPQHFYLRTGRVDWFAATESLNFRWIIGVNER